MTVIAEETKAMGAFEFEASRSLEEEEIGNQENLDILLSEEGPAGEEEGDSEIGDDAALDALVNKEIEEAPGAKKKKRAKGDWHNPSQISADPAGLTGFQRRFCQAYCYYLDGTRAYYKAGGTQTIAARVSTAAHDLLNNPKVRTFIRKRLAARDDAVGMLGIDGFDAAYRMQMFVHGSLALFLDANGAIDLSTPQAQANLDLLKKCDQRRLPNGVLESKIELFDVKDASKSVMQAIGVFSEQERARKSKTKTREKSKQIRFADVTKKRDQKEEGAGEEKEEAGE